MNTCYIHIKTHLDPNNTKNRKQIPLIGFFKGSIGVSSFFHPVYDPPKVRFTRHMHTQISCWSTLWGHSCKALSKSLLAVYRSETCGYVVRDRWFLLAKMIASLCFASRRPTLNTKHHWNTLHPKHIVRNQMKIYMLRWLSDLQKRFSCFAYQWG